FRSSAHRKREGPAGPLTPRKGIWPLAARQSPGASRPRGTGRFPVEGADMNRIWVTKRVAWLGACALGLGVVAQARAGAQRMLRPAQGSIQTPPAPLRPPQKNNTPGLSAGGLLAPFSPMAGGGGFAQGGSVMNGASQPVLSGQGQAGVAGLPGGGLGQYSAL